VLTFAAMTTPAADSRFRRPAPIPATLRRHPGFWALWLLSQLPFGGLYLVARILTWTLGSVIGYRRRVVEENVRKSFPEKTSVERLQIARDFYRNLGEIFVETLKLISIQPAELARRVETGGADLLQAYLADGKTVLALGSHSVNWEWIMPSTTVNFPALPIVGVYRPLGGAFGEALLTYMRTRLGGSLVRMQDVGRDVVRQRATPRALSMVADQTPPGGEIQFYAQFLNQDTPFFVGPDKLAASFQMPVFFLSQTRLRRGFYRYELQLFYDGKTPLPAPPKQPTDDPALHPITAAYAQFLEAEIRRNPAGYLWSHKRWKNSRPGR
jgi:Kdo2-lipid IVA lauroyltransferase/acyltransferase